MKMMPINVHPYCRRLGVNAGDGNEASVATTGDGDDDKEASVATTGDGKTNDAPHEEPNSPILATI